MASETIYMNEKLLHIIDYNGYYIGYFRGVGVGVGGGGNLH